MDIFTWKENAHVPIIVTALQCVCVLCVCTYLNVIKEEASWKNMDFGIRSTLEENKSWLLSPILNL